MKDLNPSKNMLRTLAKRSFCTSRVRNVISVIAIMLTAVLFTSVTTIGIGTQQSIMLTSQMQKLSRSDADLSYMTKEQFQELKNSSFVKSAGLRMPTGGFLTNAQNHNVELDVMDEIQMELNFCVPTHGSIPKKANEVVTSDRACRL